MHEIMKQRSFKQPYTLPIGFFFILYPLVYPILAADIIVDRTRTNQHTSIDAAANGVPIVNIARPNSNGVSHNTYIQFNVPTQGTILNNAGKEVNTQLSGYIYGNENLRNGSASLILNEVSGTSRSRLNGYLEVAGPSADVIVANPNGITVNGAGFINIPKATLTTGKVSFSGDKPIFDIEGGDIFIDGKGMDAKSTSSLELYTKAIKLNAKLYANDLKVVTGLNHINANGKVTSRDSKDKNRPLFSMDSTALGGIYANAISLVGTQKGVGVNLPSEMLVQDRLEISADGKIILGKVSVANRAEIRSHSASIEINEGVHAETLKLQALTDISLHGNSAATGDLTLLGSSLYNDGLLAAGLNADFTQATSGSMHLGLTESINNEGVFYGLDSIEIDTKKFINATQAEVITPTLTLNASQTLNNEGELSANLTTLNTKILSNTGDIHTQDSMYITAEHVNNSDGTIEGLESVTLNIANAFLNNNGTLFSDNILTLTAGSLEGIQGDIISKDQANITVTGLMHIDEGYVEAEGLNIQAEDIQANRTDLLSYGNLNIITQNMTANASNIQTFGNIEMEATKSFTQNDNALLYAAGDIDIKTQNFNHTNQSIIQSVGDTKLEATMLDNTDSQIVAANIETTTQTLNNTNGAIEGSSDVIVDTQTLNNTEGTLQANGHVNVTATGNVNNTEGTIYSGEGTTVTANEVNNEEGFIGSVKKVFLDLFNLSGDNGTISGDGVTIYMTSITSNNATIKSADALDIVASGDVTLTDSAMLSNGELNLIAKDTILNGSTLYSGHDDINVNSRELNAQNTYIEANQALTLNATKNINVSGSTIKGNDIDITTVQNVTGNGTNTVAANDLNIEANNLTHSNGQYIATNDLNITLTGTLTQNNSVIIAYHNTNIAAFNHTLTGASTLYSENALTLNIVHALNNTETSRILSDTNMTINTQTLNMNNASLFAQNTGTINTTIFNNTEEGLVSGAQMNINTTTFNNANSHFYSDGSSVNITTTGTLNNNNGFMSANGNLVLGAQTLDNRNGDLEAGYTLDVTSNNLHITNSRFFADNQLNVTSNVSNIDSESKFLSNNAMDLDFAGNLINHGEITSNNAYGGAANITVHGDFGNHSTVTANGSLNLSAHMLNNNIGARIRGAGDTTVTLSGDLNNHHFLTSSQNLEIRAQNINNYAGIAADKILTLKSTNLYNYNTLLSGTDMNLYTANLLRNHEDATIYAGNRLTIASDTNGGKTNRIENIIARIESVGDMSISAKVLENIGEVFIDYETYYYNTITEQYMTKAQRDAWVLDRTLYYYWAIQYKGYSEGTEALNDWLKSKDLYDRVVSLNGAAANGTGGVSWVELTTVIEDNSRVRSATIASGNNAEININTLLNKDAVISASKDMELNVQNLQNTPTQIEVDIEESTHSVSWWREKTGVTKKNRVYINSAYADAVTDTVHVGGTSQIVGGGQISGTVTTLNNGSIPDGVLSAHPELVVDTDVPTRPNTDTQTTNETQTTVARTDTMVTPETVDTQNNTVENQIHEAVENSPLALTAQVYDPSMRVITLPDNPYGFFITSEDPDGPLIESNPEYTHYSNFVSSDYMLDRLGYDGSSQTRRLGDAMYETQLIRDAIIAMTGQRYIGTAQNDNDQYTELMHTGVNYAQEVGLQLGIPPTDAQLEDLTEDLVWMEEKTVQGKQVLAPVLYLAKDYSKPAGANIHANAMDLTVDGHLGNSGSISTREDMTLTTGSFTNARGNIEAGADMHVSAIGDIQNLSGSIKGGSVVLTSTQGNIVNTTLSRGIDLEHSMGTEHYTYIDGTASITATSGGVMLDAAKNIDNVAASISSQNGITLNAGENVTVQTLTDERSHDYVLDNGSVGGQSTTHVESTISAEGLLDVSSGKNTTLEAVNIHAGDTRIRAQENVNITAVVDSSYRESHFENEDLLSNSSTTDMHLDQSVLGTNIETDNLVIEGNRGVTLESVSVAVSDSMQITSDEGDVTFTAKAYTNAEHHEESSSLLGGLYTERSVDVLSEILLSDSSANAENSIAVDGKNINIVATDLSTMRGSINLLAAENVNILSGMERRSEEHLREENGVSFGYSNGRFTFAEEMTDSTETIHYANRASNINTSALSIESGQDTNVIASNITAGATQVNAGRDFNVLSDRDITTNSEEHSTKEIGVEFTLNSRESSVFAGYWEDEERTESTQSEVVSSNIQAESLEVNAETTTVIGSTITGQDININSDNIYILSDSTNTNADAYTHAIKAGVEVGVRQNLSNFVDAVDEVSEAENGSAIAARGLRAYDAVQTFAEQPVTAGVTALYEESNSQTHSSGSEVVASTITAMNSLTLNATNELEIAGSDVGSANALTINANNIDIHASEGTYTTETSSESKNASVGLYGTNMGQATVGFQENEMTTTGTTQRNSQLYAGGTANIISTGDTTLSGANIEAKNLALNVGGDLNMESLQNTQTIEGSSRGGSISGNVMIGVPTGASANAGETTGERAWVSQTTGINGSQSTIVNVGGTTTLTGTSITNLNEEGQSQGNLEVTTQHLVVNDIQDIDTYEATTAGVGLNNGEGNTPKLNSVEYTNQTTDREQIIRATIGNGTINTQTTTGTVNRDTSNIQEVTRDEESNIELYASDRSLDILNPETDSIGDLRDNLKDVGLTAHVEILENLPSAIKGKDGEGDFIDNTIGFLLDSTTNLGILPSVGNSGGYITQLATQLFGDNRNILVVKDKDKLLALGILEGDISMVSQRNEITGEVIVVYTTDPDKTVRLDEEVDSTDPLDPYKIHVSSEDIMELGIGLDHLFTNGMFNDPLTAIYNQQTQQGGADALLNYNQMHGVLGDMIENVQDHVTSNLGLGSLGTGSSRQTGDVIVQMTNLNDGHVVIGAHSQGTMMTQNGLDQYQESLATVVQNNVESQFLVQYSGAPVNHNVAEDMMTDIYGGGEILKERTKNGIADVFRSHVAPEDFVGTVLGGQSAGINNSENLGENILAATGAVTDLFGWPDPSAHSYYSCILGCGDDRITPDIRNYINPNAQNGNGESPRTEDYTNRLPHVDQGLLPQIEQSEQSSNTNNNQRIIIDTTGGR